MGGTGHKRRRRETLSAANKNWMARFWVKGRRSWLTKKVKDGR